MKNFIRVGNIQYDRDAIDAIFFWLLPQLKDVAAIVTDTWSISSIALNVARLCEAYFGGLRRMVEAFTRAFKRWLGRTPARWRAERAGPAEGS